MERSNLDDTLEKVRLEGRVSAMAVVLRGSSLLTVAKTRSSVGVGAVAVLQEAALVAASPAALRPAPAAAMTPLGGRMTADAVRCVAGVREVCVDGAGASGGRIGRAQGTLLTSTP